MAFSLLLLTNAWAPPTNVRWELAFLTGSTALRSAIWYSTDPSKKASFFTNAETGGYYDGVLHTVEATIRYSPIPHLSFNAGYQANFFRNVGAEKFSENIHLYTVDARLALNPRVQLIGFYQKNTLGDRDTWNTRLAWEFKPLSFLFLVYNNRAYAGSLNPAERQQEQNFLGKLTYLKQF